MMILPDDSVAFGSAMACDWTVSAIGPFEMTEYVGLAAVYGTLAVTAPSILLKGPMKISSLE